jgi:hypothetical protein
MELLGVAAAGVMEEFACPTKPAQVAHYLA